jgi:hypothetical protein
MLFLRRFALRASVFALCFFAWHGVCFMSATGISGNALFWPETRLGGSDRYGE